VLRGLVRARLFALTAIAVLAVALAANTAIFAFVRGTLLEPPPYASPDDLVIAWGSEPINGQIRDVISGSNFVDLRRRTTMLTALAAFHGDDQVLMRDGRPDVLPVLQVTVDFLHVLGVRPALGGDFRPEDRFAGAPAAAIVSYEFWQRAFGGNPAVVGTTIELDGARTTVLGVMPKGFRFAGEWDFYVPLRDDDLAAEDRTHHHYHMVGRLAEGAGAAAASKELTAILAEIAATDPRLGRWSVLVEPMVAVTVEAVRPALWLIAGAALLVFAVSTVNLGTLMRVRTLERIRELTLRAALGATRGRVVSMVLLEALALSVAGGIAGLLLTPLALEALATVAPPQVLIPNSAASIPVLRATLELPLLIASFAAALAAGLLISAPSLVTAFRAARGLGVAQAGHRITFASGTTWMVGAELAFATVTAVGAGLTLQSAAHLASRDAGVVPTGVLTAYFGNVEARPIPARAEYFRQVLEAVAAVPGVARAATKDYRPFEGEDDFKGIRFPERPLPPKGQGIREEWRRVSQGYFATVGMRIVRGSDFAPGDFVGTPRAAVINQAFAAKHYPGQDPIGRRIVLAEKGYTDLAITGVVNDVLSRGITEQPPPVLYVPYQASPRGHVALFVKVTGDHTAYATAIRDAIWSVDPSQPVLPVIPLGDVIQRSMAVPRMTSRIVSAMAGAALMLAALGVFGVVGFAIRTRTREFAVRIALGATSGRLARQVMGGFVPTLAASLVSGLLAAGYAWSGIGAVLHGVAPGDPLALLSAATIVSAIALAATYLPARRLSRLDPARVLQLPPTH
jgi:predicted permease